MNKNKVHERIFQLSRANQAVDYNHYMNETDILNPWAAQAQFFRGSNKLENEIVPPPPPRAIVHSSVINVFFEINFEKT